MSTKPQGRGESACVRLTSNAFETLVFVGHEDPEQQIDQHAGACAQHQHGEDQAPDPGRQAGDLGQPAAHTTQPAIVSAAV